MTRIDLLALAREGPIHFMGIAGAGMAPLAELVHRSGGLVNGCDAKPGAADGALHERGVEIVEGHSPAHIEGCSALVVTAAIPKDHPEIAAAREAGIPVLKRAEALGGIVNSGLVVGIAGTHGKTTTTALATAVLDAAGLTPTALVGGRVADWESNLRLGGDELFVVEADEYDHSFLQLRPRIAVLTTLEADHLDLFGSLAGVEAAFLDFLNLVPADGLIIACADDSGVGRMLPRLGRPRDTVLTYGINPGSMLRAEGIEADGRTTSFDVREHGVRLGRANLRVPGLHNVRNALAAVAIARRLGAEWDAIADGLASYRGVDRRFEEVGDAGGVLLVDDYAHHPTEIEATLSAARAAYPERRLVAVFQPHLYSRTRDFAAEFARALAAADVLFVTDVYPAREAPIEGVTGELIATPAGRLGADARYLADRQLVGPVLAGELRAGDICITLGAGDLNAAAREILALLEADHEG